METPESILTSLREAEKRLDELSAQRPKLLSSLLQADDGADLKAAQKHRTALGELDMKIDAVRLRKTDLEAALNHALAEEVDREIGDVEETQRLLTKELQDVGKEIGALLGRAMYLERRYCTGDGYLAWAGKRTPYGGKEAIPEGCEVLFQAIAGAFGRTLEELAGSDPNAESFLDRKRGADDARAMARDIRLKEHRIFKRRAVLMRDGRAA